MKMRCPHCSECFEDWEAELDDDDDDEVDEQLLRPTYGVGLTPQEAVNRFYGSHRLEIESAPIWIVRCLGREVGVGRSEGLMWSDAFEHTKELLRSARQDHSRGFENLDSLQNAYRGMAVQ